MTYNDALNIIYNKQSLGIMPGLTRIKKLLDIMDNPQDKIKIIHIAGTNGKGTVAKTINDVLISNNLKVGLFTSPWIEDYTEQIQINNTPISNSALAEYIELYKDNDCSEFEFLTAIMYKYFADEGVDYAVIECGMGGKGDATNVEKENICSVITSVSLDHTDFLGKTIDEITAEKEGIIKNSPCFRYKDTGNFSEDNLALVKRVIDYLGYDSNITLSHLPARQERIGGVLIDGGHNVSAANALLPIIDNEVAVIGMMADKNVDGYLSLIAPRCRKIITTTPDNPRALKACDLARIADKYCKDVTAIDDASEAVAYAKQFGLSLVCGSFYLARQVRKDLM